MRMASEYRSRLGQAGGWSADHPDDRL